MKTIIQRVSSSSVSVNSDCVATIQNGYLILLGIEKQDIHPDLDADMEWLASKICSLRICADQDGRMNRSLKDIGGDILLISQFTLAGDVKKGRRPGFNNAAPPDEALGIYERFIVTLESHLGKKVQQGVFGAHMEVSLVNDGPVTFIIDTFNR